MVKKRDPGFQDPNILHVCKDEVAPVWEGVLHPGVNPPCPHPVKVEICQEKLGVGGPAIQPVKMAGLATYRLGR